MLRVLLVTAAVALGLSPFGVGVGVALALNVGWGVVAGSVAAGLVGLWALSADLVPSPPQREAVR